MRELWYATNNSRFPPIEGWTYMEIPTTAKTQVLNPKIIIYVSVIPPLRPISDR